MDDRIIGLKNYNLYNFDVGDLPRSRMEPISVERVVVEVCLKRFLEHDGKLADQVPVCTMHTY